MECNQCEKEIGFSESVTVTGENIHYCFDCYEKQFDSKNWKLNKKECWELAFELNLNASELQEYFKIHGYENFENYKKTEIQRLQESNQWEMAQFESFQEIFTRLLPKI